MAPKAPVVVPNAEGAAVAVGAPNEKDDGFAAAPNVDPNAEGAAAAGAPNPMKKNLSILGFYIGIFELRL